jgi:hypothetical protein
VDLSKVLVITRALAQRPFVLLGLLMGELYIATVSTHAAIDDWQFFDWGSKMLFGHHEAFIRRGYNTNVGLPGGLHLYGSYPFLQIGPPSFLVARLPGGRSVALAVIAVLGLFSLYAVAQAARLSHVGPPAARLLLTGGVLVVVAWAPLMGSGHLDDALALAGLAGALWSISARRPVLAGVCLGLAAASKPWAVVLLPLALGLPKFRPQLVGLAVALVTAVACWAPFVLADHRTLKLGQQGRVIGPGTPLGVLPSGWLTSMQLLRLIQFGVGLLLVGVLAARGRWELGALSAFSFRLTLDPNALAYYSAAVVLAAFIADCRPGRRMPVLTIVAAVLSLVAWHLGSYPAGALLLVLYVGFVVLALLAIARPTSWVLMGRLRTGG